MRYFASAFILIWLTACANGESADLMMPENPVMNSPDLNQDKSRDAVHPKDEPLSCSEPSSGHDPNGIHDLGDGPHFEGWYYRITQPDSENSWILIAAYWMDKDKQGHAFVELIHSPSGQTFKEIFTDVDIERIQDKAGTFQLQLGELWLSADRIKGAIRPSGHDRIFIDLTVEGCARWGAPDDARNRWTMGWATEAPLIPLKWHVHHLKAFAQGTIQTKDAEWFIDDYPIHQEKNWGRAFPTRWIWFQTNDFLGRPDVALAGAGGPVLPSELSPRGYMVGLRWKDQFFTWRTQDTHLFPESNFAIDEQTGFAHWRLVGENYRHRIEIDVSAPADELIPISVPSDGGLRIGAMEHLNAVTEVSLYRRSSLGWTLMDTVVSSSSAVEAGGGYARDEGLIP